MAKKTKTTSTNTTKKSAFTENSVTRFLAFWGLAISAVVWLVGGILGFVGLGQIANTLKLVSNIFTLIALCIPAWHYVRNRMKHQTVFLVLFIIIVIAMLVGNVFILL